MKKIMLLLISAVLIFDNLLAQYPSNTEVDTSNCTCTYLDESKDFKTYMQLLNQVVSYDDFTEFTGFDLLGAKETYGFIFMGNLITSGGRNLQGYFFEAWTVDPLLVTTSNDNFRINLTPCTKESYIHRVPLEITYEDKLKYTKFNYKKFKPSPKAYLEVLMQIASKREEEILGSLISPERLIVKDTLRDAWEWMGRINKKYKTTIKLDSFSSDWRGNGGIYVDNLKKHKVNVLDFIINEFFLDEKGTADRDSLANERLACFFSRWMGNTRTQTLDRYYIPPQVKAKINRTTIGLQFSDKMLRILDPKEPASDSDSIQISIPNTLLAQVGGLVYSNAKGFEGNLYDICMPVCEIAGTGILFDVEEALLSSAESKAFKAKMRTSYPLLLYKDSIRKYRCLHYEYDTLTKAFDLKPANLAKEFIRRYNPLRNFEGLMIEQATFVIPYKKEKLTGIGTDILLSNHLFTGKIVFSIVPTSKKGVVELIIGKSKYKLKLKAFERYLKRLGFDGLMLEEKEHELFLYFKKLND
jgi:hypothetical protein